LSKHSNSGQDCSAITGTLYEDIHISYLMEVTGHGVPSWETPKPFTNQILVKMPESPMNERDRVHVCMHERERERCLYKNVLSPFLLSRKLIIKM
jgi:hypothetical protein